MNEITRLAWDAEVMGKARRVRLGIAVGAMTGSLFASSAAVAGLGGKAPSVQLDRVQLGARLQTTPQAGRTLFAMTRPNGASVKEFTNAAGAVFAVTWSGPGKPDLRTLLGPHFNALQAASRARDPRFRRVPPQVHQSDLVIQTGGHMGYFWGVAYIPSLAPAGFSVADLK
jgi:hypothetical protein